MTECITLTQEDLVEGLNKITISIGFDLCRYCYCLNITTPTEVFGCELKHDNLMTSPHGGELTIDNAKKLHAFLTDLLGYYD